LNKNICIIVYKKKHIKKMTVGTCPGCGYAPAKTRDLNRHMDLTRKNPCKHLLELSKPNNTPTHSEKNPKTSDLISFNENPLTTPTTQPQNGTDHLLDLPIDGAIPETSQNQKGQKYPNFDELEKWINKPNFIDLDKEVPWPIRFP
jgi:hypothetical protein